MEIRTTYYKKDIPLELKKNFSYKYSELWGSVRHQTKFSVKATHRLLRKLRKEGKIERYKSKVGWRYKIVEKLDYQDFVHVYTFVATRPVSKTRRDGEGKIMRDAQGNIIKERLERKLEGHLESCAIITPTVQSKVEDLLREIVRHYSYEFMYQETNALDEASSWKIGAFRNLTSKEKKEGLLLTAELYDHTYSKTIFKISKVMPIDWFGKELSEIIKNILG